MHKGTAAALLFTCPYTDRGQGLSDGGAQSSHRVLTLGASLGREGGIPESLSGLWLGLGQWLSQGP